MTYDQGRVYLDLHGNNWDPQPIQSNGTVYDAAPGRVEAVIKQVRRMDLKEGDLIVLESWTMSHEDLVRLQRDAGALADHVGIRFLVLPPGVTLAGVVAGADLEMEDTRRLFDRLRQLQARLDAVTGSAEEPV